MSLSEEFCEQLKCCLGDHIVENAVTLSCSHSACYKCVQDNCGKFFKCKNADCNKSHRIFNADSLPKNELLEILIKANENLLIERLKEHMKQLSTKIQAQNLADEIISDMFKSIDSKIQNRISSLKSQTDSLVKQMKENVNLKKEELKPKIEDLISMNETNATIQKIKEDIELGKTDYSSFQKNMKNLQKLFRKTEANSLGFVTDQRRIKAKLIAEIGDIDTQQSDETKDQVSHEQFDSEEIHFGDPIVLKSFSFELGCLPRLVYIDTPEKNYFLICDSEQGKLMKVNSETFEVLSNENPNNKLQCPVSICFNGNDKIFVGDYKLRKILAFDLDLNYLSESTDVYNFQPFDIDYDLYENHLYASEKRECQISVWDANDLKKIRSMYVDTPSQVKVLKDKLIVLGGIYFTLLNKSTKRVDKITQGKNRIMILNKEDGKELKSIKMPGWFDLRGLYMDHNENIYTAAVELEKNFKNIKSDLCLLFKIDASGKLIQKQDIGVSNVRDILFVNKKLFLLRGKIKPQFNVIEFN